MLYYVRASYSRPNSMKKKKKYGGSRNIGNGHVSYVF